MITILEGTDGVGKSTYGKALTTHPGSVLLHSGPPQGNPVDMYLTRIVQWLEQAEHIVLDRSFIGSRVWSGLGFHEPTLTPDLWNYVCLWYARHGGAVLLIVRPPAHVDAELQARDESIEERLASMHGQRDFIRMAATRDILYMPVAVTTSDLIHNHQKEHGTTWN